MRIVLIVLGTIAAIIIAAVAWFALTRPQESVPEQPQIAAPNTPQANAPSAEAVASAKDKLDRALKISLEFQPFFERMKTLYPADFERFTLAETQTLAANPLSLASSDALILDAVDGLRKNRGAQAAKASPPAMDRVFEVQGKVLDALAAQDPRLCEHFLFGGDAPAFAEFSAKNRALIAEMADAGMTAIADGEANKIERQPPADEDFNQLEKRLIEMKLEKTEMAALLDGQMPEKPFEPERTCAFGKSYYSALRTLPDDARYSIYALALQNMAQ